MASFLPIYGMLAAAGAATHLGYFNRSEHHLYGTKYLQIALAILVTGVAGMMRVGGEPFRAALSSVLALEGSFLFGLYTSLILYRVVFHPLNKFPGPFGARVSNLYWSSNVAGADAHKKLLKLHKEMGDFVRVGSNDLSIIHPEGPNTVYGPGTKCTKAPWYDNDAPLTSMHTTRQRALHDRRRRVWSPAFSDKALRGYEERIKSYGDKLAEQLGAFSGKPVNASKWFNLYSFDVMGDLAFGKSFDMLEKGEEHWAIKLLNEGMEPLALQFPPWFFRVLTGIPGLAAGYWKFINFCSAKLDERWNTKVDTPDIMHSLIEPFKEKPTGQELSMLQGDARLIIVAGSDTTAATLTHLFYQLARDPSQVDKLRDELSTFVDADGNVEHVKIVNADHLNGVINETLRLNPPVPSAVYRLTPPEGITIGGTYIPGNMTVFCPQYVIARNEDAYTNAEKFHPERWYKDSDMVKNKTAFAPFSVGVYGCIGKPLALLEIRTLVAKLITLYDIGFAKGEDGSKLLNDTRDHFTLGLADLNLSFTKRK